MRDDIKFQMNKIKRECFILSQLTGYDRMQVVYNKQKKFTDEGTLDLINIQHCFSS